MSDKRLNDWGDLTGVKPLKLYRKLIENHGKDEAEQILDQKHGVSQKKIELLDRINRQQIDAVNEPKSGEVSIYIGIPFCPTRCNYCSFTSNQKDSAEILRYMNALYKEMEYVSDKMKKHGLRAETLYVGGGTPTTLETKELAKLLRKIKADIPAVSGAEFTVEAGRPDTIGVEKLKAVRDTGVTRISINPQTMKDETLKLIGRDHSSKQVREAFELAKDIGFYTVNSDVIAGLPEEVEADFRKTLKIIERYEPENVTVHTLALKRGSKLAVKMMEEGQELSTKYDTDARKMVEYAEISLDEKGYKPYYIYRQKYMADNLENVGYAKKGHECIYNIRIMEEKQTVIALGAGGSSKVFFPEEDRLERVVNVSNYEQYIDRIDEMTERKENGLFEGGPY